MLFPKTPQNTYSVTRFLKGIEQGHIPSKAWLGGRLEQREENQIWLSGQGQIVSLKTQGQWLKGIEPGDEICVRYEKTQDILFASDPVLLVKAKRQGVTIPNPWVAQWFNFLTEVREKLSALGLQEVQTPSLVQNPGMEPHLTSFETSWDFGSKTKRMFLPTSPELHMKQLLSSGWTDIFEIKNCFRSEEFSKHHEPEFTMLEWYRAFSDLELIKSDLKALLRKFDPQIEFLDMDVEGLIPEKVVMEIEPNLPKDKAVFLTGYPASEAALARVTDDGKADRFELYWKGLEIANAFHELNDPAEQRRRHLADQKYRQENGLQEYPLDENFLGGLEQGMPPSGGIALGLDRLFMALYDVPSIQEMRLFPITHQLRGEL